MNIFEGKVIGIDLGTTYSLVAIIEQTNPMIIPNAEGNNKTPSVVAFLDKGEIVVGEIARRQAITNASRTITSIKRLMGRPYSELSDSNETFPYKIIGKDDQILIDINGMGYKPEQISALILQKLKEASEKYLREQVDHAIITVPAYFNDLQRNATKEAARLAGLEVLRLINEPTAAAMAYGLGKESEEITAVYDFGGGTFDVSILEIDHNAFEVLVSNGDTHLGGDDLDNALVNWIKDDFQNTSGIDISQDPVTLFRLKEAAEKAKCELSTTTKTIISLPFLAFDNKKPLHLEKTITRDEFEELIRKHVARTIEFCRQAIHDAGISKHDITKVILVGGSSRIPMVKKYVEDFFGMTPFKGVNPDEIVALGAATQAGIFTGNLQEVVLLDITPHSLGVEVKNSKVSRIIEKNSTIPIKAAKTFTTTENDQTFVHIHVIQGEEESVSENQSLGKFTLSDIEPAPSGVPRIRITFFINADGVLEISAQDLASGREKNLTITHSFLTEEERKKLKSRKKHDIPKKVIRDHETKEQAGEILAAVELESPLQDKDTTDKDITDIDVIGASSFRIIKNGTQTEEPSPKPVQDPLAVALSMGTDTGINESSTLVQDKSFQKEWLSQSLDVSEPFNLPIDPELEEQIRTCLVHENRDDESLQTYNEFQQQLDALVKEKSPIPPIAYILLSHTLTLSGNYEESRNAIHEYQECPNANPSLALEAYEFLIRYFPSYNLALKERAHLLKNLKLWKDALRSYERVHEDGADMDMVNDLEEIYTEILKNEKDPVIEFKLVKIYLKKSRLEEAIGLLQELINNEKHKLRALKILGLTYWQKKMYSQAWKTFKILPPKPDLLDLLYRLGNDLEKSGNLHEAREVYERIATESPDYANALSKMKKMEYRIQILQEEEEQQKAFQVLQDPRFAIIEEINRGSMGVIYKARDTVVDDIVALKVLNDYLCEDPKAVERFKSEARAAKKLSHPYIVRIHDLFESGKKMFLSMEFIEGTDLKQMLSGKIKFGEDKILYYCLQILDALHYAHSLGIIHRDIKPANIMIKPDNRVKITDFGIAKILKAESITKSGTAIIGTPLYMSPEQIIGGAVDARADIYSLGIMLYEMVSGDPPFCNGNIEYHHVNTEPDQVQGQVSEKLKNVIMKMIRKNPEERYQTIQEIFSHIKS
ncbi:molecular chaperone DnaK [Candidatus Sumerlaeota bacterium]|nr:molecular chaperone DnaK [Candidatus Sumerlaeota bacterium]